MTENDFKIKNAKEVFLKDFNEASGKIAIIGQIKMQAGSANIFLEEDSNKIELLFEDDSLKKGLLNGLTIRVIGQKEDVSKIKVQTIHELKAFDSQLFKDLKKFEKK